MVENKSILLFGSTGLFGSYFNNLYSEYVIPVSHEDVDITNYYDIIKVIKKYHPKYIINAAGRVPKAFTDDLDMFKVNSYGPKILEKISNEHDINLIQISTDCVFSGKCGLYSELDTPDAESVYGISKYLGETNDKHLTIRTSFIGFPDLAGRGLLAWLFSQKESVDGYVNHLWNGLTVIELCHQIFRLLDKKGLIHLHGKDTVSKYELLNLVKKVYGLKVEIVPKETSIINRTLVSINDGRVDKSLLDMLIEMRLSNEQ